MSKNPGAIRLQKEHMQIAKRYLPYEKMADPDPSSIDLHNYLASPLPDNIYTWFYLIYGLKDCPYQGGFYIGRILFPKEYPLKPPRIEMKTPNGRFKVNTRLCLSMSDYHPETWNPAWCTHTIIQGLISFMCEDEITAGAIKTNDEQKAEFAEQSLKYNMKNIPEFKSLFEPQFKMIGVHQILNPPSPAVASPPVEPE